MMDACVWIASAAAFLLTVFYLFMALVKNMACAIASELAGPDKLHMEFEADCTEYHYAEIADIFFVAYHEDEDRDTAINEVKNASWQLQYRLNQITPDGIKLAKRADAESSGPSLAWSIKSTTGGTRYPLQITANPDGEDEYEDINMHGKKAPIHWSQIVLKVEVNTVKTLWKVLDSLTGVEHTHVKGVSWQVSIPTAERMHAQARKGAIQEAKQKAYDFARKANHIPSADVRILEIVKEELKIPMAIYNDDESSATSMNFRREGSQKETNVVTEPPQFRCVQRVQAKFVGCKIESWEDPVIVRGRKLLALWNALMAPNQKSV